MWNYVTAVQSPQIFADLNPSVGVPHTALDDIILSGAYAPRKLTIKYTAVKLTFIARRRRRFPVKHSYRRHLYNCWICRRRVGVQSIDTWAACMHSLCWFKFDPLSTVSVSLHGKVVYTQFSVTLTENADIMMTFNGFSWSCAWCKIWPHSTSIVTAVWHHRQGKIAAITYLSTPVQLSVSSHNSLTVQYYRLLVRDSTKSASANFRDVVVTITIIVVIKGGIRFTTFVENQLTTVYAFFLLVFFCSFGVPESWYNVSVKILLCQIIGPAAAVSAGPVPIYVWWPNAFFEIVNTKSGRRPVEISSADFAWRCCEIKFRLLLTVTSV